MTPERLDPDAAAALLDARGDVIVLDVRTPEEYEGLGHIPGAWLLPVDLVAAAPAVLPADGRPVLVCCEHGIRSAAAARWLAAAGVPHVIDMAGGMSCWSGPRSHEPGVVRGPSAWLLDNADLVPRGARVLDVAAGRGRHALLLAAAGLSVHAIDRDAAALASIAAVAARMALDVRVETRDLEAGPPALEAQAYDLVVAFNYLHRPLMPAIREAVKPGGLLFYETLLVGQAERGHPTNPAFLLRPGELAGLVAPLVPIRSREGEIDGRLMAAIVARRLPR